MVQSELDLKSDPAPPSAGRIPINANLSSAILLFLAASFIMGRFCVYLSAYGALPPATD